MEQKAKKPEEREKKAGGERHVQFPQESWTEIDAEGTDSEMAEGRQMGEPFYTPLVTEAAERKLKEEQERRRAAKARQDESENEGTSTGEKR